MSSSSGFRSAKLTKQIARVEELEARNLSHAELDERGKLAAVAIATRSSGKATKHKAKLEADRFAAYQVMVERHRLGLGPAPAPYVSAAEEHRVVQLKREAANKAKMMALEEGGALFRTSNSSSGSDNYAHSDLEFLMYADPSTMSGARQEKCKMMNRIRMRAEAEAERIAEQAYMRRMTHIRCTLMPRFTAWAKSFALLRTTAFQRSRDITLSKTQRQKYLNILRCVTTGDLRHLPRATTVAASSSDTIHISNLPGPFDHREMANVLKMIRAKISKSAPHMLNGKSGHSVVRNMIAMRGGKSSGFGIFQMASAPLASAVVTYLNENTDLLSVSVKCMDNVIRTGVIKIQLAMVTQTKTKQQAREDEERVREERKLAVHEENVRRANAVKEAKRAKQAFDRSFVALPGTSAKKSVAKPTTGPSFRDLLLADKPAPVVEALPTGWHEGVIYDEISLDVPTMLAQYRMPDTRVFTMLSETGWIEQASAAEIRKIIAAEEAVAAAAAAAERRAAASLAHSEVIRTKGALAVFFRRV